MKNVILGHTLKHRREELGITQEDLCDTILSAGSLSKIENGVTFPRKATFEMLISRLGFSKKEYIPLSNPNEYKFEQLKYQILIEQMNNNIDEVKKLLLQLEKNPLINENIEKQFYLKTKTLCYKKDLPPSQYYQQLLEAIHLTNPKFNEDNNYLSLSDDETNIIINIAVFYSDNGNNQKALKLYSKLLDYVQNHFLNLEDKAIMSTLISYNYSRILNHEKNFKKAILIADIGIDYSRKYNKMMLLGKLLSNKAYSLCKINCMIEGKFAYKQAYATFFALNQVELMQMIKENAEQFNLNIE